VAGSAPLDVAVVTTVPFDDAEVVHGSSSGCAGGLDENIEAGGSCRRSTRGVNDLVDVQVAGDAGQDERVGRIEPVASTIQATIARTVFCAPV
jgi:hypothetical protein